MTAYDWDASLTPSVENRSFGQSIAPGQKVAVYGSGTAAAECIRLLTSQGVQITHVLDGNTKRTQVESISIVSPESSIISMEIRRATPVVIGIFNCAVNLSAIITRLHSLGWGAVFTYFDFHHHLSSALGERYWLTARDFYRPHREDIQELDSLWADSTSRSIYRALLRFRVTGNLAELPELTSPQYFPADLPAVPQPLRLIDGGAFDGDTLIALKELKLPVEEIVAFEPDLPNFVKLAQVGREMRASIPRMTLVPCGLWSATAQLHFSSGNASGSALSGAGETVIPVVSLDDALPSFEPNLIKLDIEGAEPEALAGAKAMIQRAKPRLAVCVYHKPDHLWTLPLMLHRWNLGYRMHLRAHMHNGFDTVLYAIPGPVDL